MIQCSLNANLLYEISQFRLYLSNTLISQNVNFVKNVGFESDPFDSFNAQVLEEINAYKVYEC